MPVFTSIMKDKADETNEGEQEKMPPSARAAGGLEDRCARGLGHSQAPWKRKREQWDPFLCAGPRGHKDEENLVTTLEWHRACDLELTPPSSLSRLPLLPAALPSFLWPRLLPEAALTPQRCSS